jgi:hypothetical protein
MLPAARPARLPDVWLPEVAGIENICAALFEICVRLLGSVELYKRETREVIERFLRQEISFPDCIAALDAALAELIPRLSAEQLAPLRALMLANNGIVMKEMERRGPPKDPT